MTVEAPTTGDGVRPRSADIAYETYDGVGVATFNRPESLNSFRASTRDELRAIFHDVRSDDQVRVLVLTGEGRAFSAGQDLEELGDVLVDLRSDPRDGMTRVEELQDLTRQLLDLGKPVVAAINGVAVGLGAELALACDMRIASVDATLGFVESKRALFPTNGVMYLLPRLVGYGTALELLLTGDLVSAAHAARIGLVSRVVEANELLAASLTVAGQIARNAPVSVRLIREVLRRTYEVDFAQMMQLEIEASLTCLASDDFREGVESFLQKRKPSYEGDS